jgi:hypothetical protein
MAQADGKVGADRVEVTTSTANGNCASVFIRLQSYRTTSHIRLLETGMKRATAWLSMRNSRRRQVFLIVARREALSP